MPDALKRRVPTSVWGDTQTTHTIRKLILQLLPSEPDGDKITQIIDQIQIAYSLMTRKKHPWINLTKYKKNVITVSNQLLSSNVTVPKMSCERVSNVSMFYIQVWIIIIAQIAPLSFQGSHRTQTQTSEVRWLHASVVTEWSPACLHKQFPGDLHRCN